MRPIILQSVISGLALGPPWGIISTGGEPQFPLEKAKHYRFPSYQFFFQLANETHYIHRSVLDDPIYSCLG
jgi:hypothetical protein